MSKVILVHGRLAERIDGLIEGAQLVAKSIKDEFSVEITTLGRPSKAKYDIWRHSFVKAKETLISLRDTVNVHIEGNTKPVIIANTCSSSLATLPVVAQIYTDIKILWIDVHADFNTPTTSTSTSTSNYLGLWSCLRLAVYGKVVMVMASTPPNWYMSALGILMKKNLSCSKKTYQIIFTKRSSTGFDSTSYWQLTYMDTYRLGCTSTWIFACQLCNRRWADTKSTKKYTR